ncbi:MAG TPA: PaaI family thioesterase [Pyrinomonadaceae bacterium]|nr:PaaI family thioesterase [Pyrinomonadaceae bacterium]
MDITEERKQRAVTALGNLPFAKLLGMRLVDIRPDEAIVEIEMRDDLRQPSGVLHGGVTATIIDTAMAFAVRAHLEDHEYTATIDLTVHYLRPHTSGKIICTAKCVRAGKRIFTLSADVKNEEGKLIATGLSTYTRV